MFRNGRLISTSVLFAMAVGACTPVTTPSASEIQPVPNPNSLSVPVPTEANPFPTADMDPTIVALATPEARGTAMAENANAYATEGPNVIIDRGFPPEILKAQTQLGLEISTHFIYENVERVSIGGFKADATLINLDGTDLNEFILISTAGHVRDLGYIASEIETDIHSQLGDAYINFLNVNVNKITVGGTEITSDMFGMVSFFDNFDKSYVDAGFILVRKSDLPQNLIDSALPFDKISFTKPDASMVYSNMCNPVETGYQPVVFTDATYAGDFGNATLIEGMVSGGGCSGSGVGGTDANGNSFLSGINVANFANRVGSGNLIVVQNYSYFGRQGMLDILTVAKLDLDLKASQP